MRPTRATQPYRRGARTPGAALSAMLKGAPAFMANPMDARRKALKRRRRKGALRRTYGQ